MIVAHQSLSSAASRRARPHIDSVSDSDVVIWKILKRRIYNFKTIDYKKANSNRERCQWIIKIRIEISIKHKFPQDICMYVFVCMYVRVYKAMYSLRCRNNPDALLSRRRRSETSEMCFFIYFLKHLWVNYVSLNTPSNKNVFIVNLGIFYIWPMSYFN